MSQRGGMSFPILQGPRLEEAAAKAGRWPGGSQRSPGRGLFRAGHLPLAVENYDSYFAAMKRFISVWLVMIFLGQISPWLAAQTDPARAAAEAADRQEAQERALRLKAIIEDVVAAQSAQQKRMLALIEDMKVLRDDTAEAVGKCATAADLKKLDEKITALEKSRQADRELILGEIAKLAKALAATPASAHPPPHGPTVSERTIAERRPVGVSTTTVKIKPPEVKAPEPAPKVERGVEHLVNQGEFFSTILTAYNAEFKKLGKKPVTQKQVLASNPGLNPNNIRVGQKIFIPVLD